MKNIGQMWSEFLLWIEDYTDGESEKVIQYSREDMRYAYQAGYESFCKSIVKKVDPDNLPEDNVVCVSKAGNIFTGALDSNDGESVFVTLVEGFEIEKITHYIDYKGLIKLFAGDV